MLLREETSTFWNEKRKKKTPAVVILRMFQLRTQQCVARSWVKLRSSSSKPKAIMWGICGDKKMKGLNR